MTKEPDMNDLLEDALTGGNLLSGVTKGKESHPRRTLVYGTDGIGKSTFANSFPNPIFIRAEDRLDHIDCHKFPLLDSTQTALKQLTALGQEDHDYKTVVLDSGDWYESIIHAEIAKARNKDSIADIGFQAGYEAAVVYWQKLLDGFDWLRKQKSIEVVIITHAIIININDTNGDSYAQYAPKLHKHASALLRSWVDEILFIRYKTYTKTKGEGFKKREVGVGSGERIILTAARPGHVAKNSCDGLPPELSLDYDEYIKYFKETTNG
ncbi:MAG: ATP-binding protein [FCB group bacterium]|nr:ATP-binding protein [FCB group bacterium]